MSRHSEKVKGYDYYSCERLFSLTSKQRNINKMRYYLLSIRMKKLGKKPNTRVGESLKKNESSAPMLFDSDIEGN